MRRLGLALAIPAFLILLIASSGFAFAQEWDRPQVSLEPGESVVVEFANETENSVTLTIQNISAPSELLSFVTFSPWEISENSSINVCITFLPVIENVRQGIMPDNYAVQINGASSGLIVILNMTGNFEGIPSENYDPRIAWLEAQTNDLAQSIEALHGSFEEWADNFLARLKALEDAPAEDWAGEIENLRAELENIRNTPHDNSPAENSGNLENRLRSEFDDKLAQIKRDLIAKTKSDEETNMIYAAVVAAIVAMVVIAVAGKFGMIKKTFGIHTVSKTGPASEVTDDQIAMLENTIGAMRERGEPANAIKKKELELKFLKDSQELEKPEEEKPVEKKPEVE